MYLYAQISNKYTYTIYYILLCINCMLFGIFCVFIVYQPSRPAPRIWPPSRILWVSQYTYVCICVYISIVKYPYIWGFIVYLLTRPASSLVAASALQPLAISP